MECVEEEGAKVVTSVLDTAEMKQENVIVTLKLDNEQEGGLKKWSAPCTKISRGMTSTKMSTNTDMTTKQNDRHEKDGGR